MVALHDLRPDLGALAVELDIFELLLERQRRETRGKSEEKCSVDHLPYRPRSSTPEVLTLSLFMSTLKRVSSAACASSTACAGPYSGTFASSDPSCLPIQPLAA